MDSKKILLLLIAFIVYTNYENYYKEDVSKLHRQIANLKTNIEREVEVQKENHTKESLLIDYSEVTFDGKKHNYSQAMGEMQNQINEAAKDVCTINTLKWAQVPSTEEWYDKLRMNLSLSCKPKDLFIFADRLKEKPTIFTVENFRVTKDKRKTLLNINLQLVAFRTVK